MYIAMLTAICTAYIIIVGRMLMMRAGILFAVPEKAVPSISRRISRWASLTAYYFGALAWGAAAGVVLSVVLDWYWSIW